MDIKENIELELSRILCEKNYNDRGLIKEYFDSLEKLLSNLENIFNDETKSSNLILDGEFNPTRIYMGSDGEKGIPLYLSLDILKYELEERYLNKEDLKEKTSTIIKKLEDLRSKSVNLSFDTVFNPNEKLNEAALKNISSAFGNMSVSIEKTGDQKYLAIKTTIVNEDVEYKNGDYISKGASYNKQPAMPLYQSDFDKIETAKKEQSLKNLDRLKNITFKYFVDNTIPYKNDFYDKLKDLNLNTEIKYTLYDISELYSKEHNIYSVADKCQILLDKIEKYEIILEEAKQKNIEIENKESAIKEAKERYNSKNFLWKTLNKKMNPQKQNFKEMTTEDINSLYKGRKK